MNKTPQENLVYQGYVIRQQIASIGWDVKVEDEGVKASLGSQTLTLDANAVVTHSDGSRTQCNSIEHGSATLVDLAIRISAATGSF